MIFVSDKKSTEEKELIIDSPGLVKELKKDDRKDHTHKPAQEKHHRQHADGKRTENKKEDQPKKEHHDKHKEQHQERIHQHQEHRETTPKG